MFREALGFDNVVEICRVEGFCSTHVLHVGDVLQYVEGSARVLEIMDDGVRVGFLRRMNSRRRRLKTGEVWRLRRKDVCVMPLPRKFTTVEEWLSFHGFDS